MKSASDQLQLRVNALNHSVRQTKRLEKELDELRTENQRLKRDRGKFGHGCTVDSSFFGTSVKVSTDEVKMSVLFFWYNGYPAIQIQQGPAQTILLRAALVDGEFENLPRVHCNDEAPWQIEKIR